MTANYSNYYRLFTPEGCDEPPHNIYIHIIEIESGMRLSSAHLHDTEKLVLANKKRTESQKQYLASRKFIKTLYLPDSKHWVNYQVEYRPQEKAVCLFTKNSIVKKLSLSHSNKWIAVLDTPTGAGAIDVQYHNKSDSVQNAMQKTFCPSDQRLILQNQQTFFDLWAIKEAYAKLNNLSIFDVLTTPLNVIHQNCNTEIIPLFANISVAIALSESNVSNKTVMKWLINKEGQLLLQSPP